MSEQEQQAEQTLEQVLDEGEAAHPEENQQPAETSQNDGGKQENDGFQKRINKITAEKYDYKRRAEEAERRLQTFEQSQQSSVNHFGAGSQDNIPTLEQFDYDEEKYQDALIAHKVEQATRKATQDLQNQFQQRQREAETSRLQAEHVKRVQAAKIPGFQEAAEALANNIPLTQEIVELIQGDPNGPQLIHHLGNNLDVASDLVSSSDHVAAMKLGKISAFLSAQPQKKTTQAPDPPKTAAAAGGGAPPKSYEDMSMEEIDALPI